MYLQGKCCNISNSKDTRYACPKETINLYININMTLGYTFKSSSYNFNFLKFEKIFRALEKYQILKFMPKLIYFTKL